MGIQINGSTDHITAIDGTIDFVSNIGNIGLITASRYELLDSITIGAGSTIIKTVNGKIGIGTASPDRIIHAFEPTGNNLLFLESGDTNVDIIQADTGGSTRIRNSQGSLVFYVNGDARSSNAANAVTGLTIDGDKDVHVYDDLFIPDKIIHEGDTNTAIRFPAADQIQLETAGSVRTHIHSDGRFRVGCTAQPSGTVGGFQLDMGSYPGTLRLMSGAGASGTDSASINIGGSNHNASLAHGANYGAQLSLTNFNTTDGNSTAVSFLNSNQLAIARVLGNNASHSSRTGNLVFMTSSGTHPVERARITSDGKLGVGVASPVSILHLHEAGSSGAPIIQFSNGDTGTTTGDGFAIGLADNESPFIYNRENTDLRIATNNTERLRIEGGGDVSIGNIDANTFSNYRTLTIGGAGASDGAGIDLERSDGTIYGRFFADANGVQIGAPASGDYIRFECQANEKFRISSTGVTVTGTTDGVLNLDTSDSRGSFIRFQQGGATEAWVGCGQGLSLGGATTLAFRSDADIRIRTGTEEHVTITSTGYLAAKGEAGNWIYGNHPANYTFHQFSSSKNGDWMMQFRQEHHNGLGFNMRVNNNNNNEAIALYRENQSNYGFKVYNTGNVQNINNSYGSLSDVSLKENIVDAKSQWNDIKAVKVRNFNLKDDADKVKMLGVVAQELESVSPKLVFEDKDGVKGVHYSILYMKAIKALQESQTRIETLESKVAALEGS